MEESRDLREFIMDIVSRPWFRAALNGLHDFRALEIAPSEDCVTEFADFYRLVTEALGDGRVALLVSERAKASVAKSFIALIGRRPRELGLFDDAREATDWLGLPVDYKMPSDVAHVA